MIDRKEFPRRRLYRRTAAFDVLFRREPFGNIGGAADKLHPVLLTVRPAVSLKTGRRLSGKFDGFIDDRQVVIGSATPFCDASRALLAEGVSPDAVIEMRHEGSSTLALRSTVGVAAKLTVEEGRRPYFRRHRERPEKSR